MKKGKMGFDGSALNVNFAKRGSFGHDELFLYFCKKILRSCIYYWADSDYNIKHHKNIFSHLFRPGYRLEYLKYCRDGSYWPVLRHGHCLLYHDPCGITSLGD